MRVLFCAFELFVPFRMFVAEEADRGRILSVDHLLVIQQLLKNWEIDTATAAPEYPADRAKARASLSRMEADFGYLERGGMWRDTCWTLRHDLIRRLSAPEHPERIRRIAQEAAKIRVMSVLKQQAEKREPGLSNTEIRRITHLDRTQVKWLMAEFA